MNTFKTLLIVSNDDECITYLHEVSEALAASGAYGVGYSRPSDVKVAPEVIIAFSAGPDEELNSLLKRCTSAQIYYIYLVCPSILSSGRDDVKFFQLQWFLTSFRTLLL